MNNKKESAFKNLSKKDKIVVLVSIVAIIVLIAVIIFSRKSENNKQSKLSDISQDMQNNTESATYDGLMMNEVNKNGWIEFYNTKAEEEDISNVTIWLNGQNIYTVPDGTQLGSKEMKVVETGSSFGNSEHDIITVKDKDGNDIVSEIIPLLDKDESYGAPADGAIERAYISATKGESNNNASKADKNDIAFSVPGGFYSDSFNLEITAPQGCTVYYTTDGTEPTKDSAQYTDPIEVTNKSGSTYVYAKSKGVGLSGEYEPESINIGMVVRAIAVDSAGNIQNQKSQSYFIGLASSSEYKNIPVISVTTNPENLFDYYEGMYVSGRSQEDAIARGDDTKKYANYLNGWTKKAHIEYFEPNKDKTYEGDVDLSMLVDMNVASAQKGFSVKGDNDGAWDGSSLKNFLSTENTTFKIQTNQYDNEYKIRDYLANDLLSDTAAGTSDISPCIVFIDGEYWGAYMLKADCNKEYLKTKYNISDDNDVIIIKNKSNSNYEYQSLFNSFYSFVSTSDMSVSANYEKVKSQMDIQSYIDYYCANMYLANAGFTEETTIWRTADSGGSGYADGKWRWITGRMDRTMNCTSNGKVSTESIDSFLQPSVTDDKFFNSLLKNKDFCKDFYNTMKKMSETTFSTDKTNESISNLSAKVQKMALNSYKRFYGNVKDDYYSSEIKVIQEFFEKRGEYILKYTQEITGQ